MLDAGKYGPPTHEFRRGKEKFVPREEGKRNNGDFKQSFALSTKPLKVSPHEKKFKATNGSSSSTFQNRMKGKISFRERQEKTYPFLDSDIRSLFDTLLRAKLIQLHEMKRPKEADKVKDPGYCIYHRLLGHPVEKCFVLKDKIMDLYNEVKIEFEDDSNTSNAVFVNVVNVPPRMIRFGSFEPTHIRSQKDEDL